MKGELVGTGGSWQPDVNHISASHPASLWHPLRQELWQSVAWKKKITFLGTVKVTSPPIFSFIGPLSPSLALFYKHNSCRTPVVWPVGILIELDANVGSQTLKPSKVSSEHKYRSEISFKKNEQKKTSARRYRWWWSPTKSPPTEGVLASGAVPDLDRTLVSPRLSWCWPHVPESHPAASTA